MEIFLKIWNMKIINLKINPCYLWNSGQFFLVNITCYTDMFLIQCILVMLALAFRVHVESKCGTEKKYKCSECRVLHLSQASLNTHMITEHVEKKSHQCDYCSSSFTSKDKLEVHERMHTDTKPFKCNVCILN